MRINPCLLLATLFGGSALLSGCFFEDDERFEESAAMRLKHYNEVCDRLLQAPAHGWMMPYRIGATDDSVCLFLRFAPGGVVEVAGLHPFMPGRDMRFAYASDTSLYRLTGEDGPTLVFDSYNDVLSCFADPLDNGVGLAGDYNFKLLDVTPQRLTLVGQRHGGVQHMVPSPTSYWESYALLAMLLQLDGMLEFCADEDSDPRWLDLHDRLKQVLALRSLTLDEVSLGTAGHPVDGCATGLLVRCGSQMCSMGADVRLDGMQLTLDVNREVVMSTMPGFETSGLAPLLVEMGEYLNDTFDVAVSGNVHEVWLTAIGDRSKRIRLRLESLY